jgi:tetratricopeptide (TPR) repeat protein
LLLFPLHLSADYNPQQVRVLTAAGWSGALGGFLVLVAGWGAWLLRRRVPTVSFGLLWAAVTLFPVSNLLIPTGILLAERTLFLPSLGVLLAVGGAASGLLPGLQRQPARRRWLVFAGLWLVLAAWVIRSAVRQPVWKDNATLFARTLVDAPRSYKAVAAHAVMLLEAGQEVEGEREYRRALGLFPDDPNLFADLGDWYLRKGRCEEALDSYARVLALVPAHWAATSRTILCLIRLGRLAEAREAARVATRRGDEGASQKLAYVDSLIAARNRVP